MGNKFADIEEEQRLILHIRSNDKQMEMVAILKKHLKDNLAVIDLLYSGPKPLNFDNVDIDMEYCPEQDVPFIWHNVKIVFYKNAYVLQVFSDGIRNNRRNSFRISVAKKVWCKIIGGVSQHAIVKDISLSGFSITDQKKELNMTIGSQLSFSFEDWGYQIDLEGRVVRIEEREDMTIYGMVICNVCNDLSPYINMKQRRNRK